MDSIKVIPDVDYAKKKYDAIMELVNAGTITPKYPNTVQGHLVGRMGEDAVFEYMQKLELDPYANYKVTNEGCDIFLRKCKLRLEVKTWRFKQFEWGGRAISTKQMSHVRHCVDRIVWCSVKDEEVFIHGWSNVTDFNNAPIVTKGKLNLQSYQLNEVRGMASFTGAIL